MCCSLLHLECHSIFISNRNLRGLFARERGKRDRENEHIESRFEIDEMTLWNTIGCNRSHDSQSCKLIGIKLKVHRYTGRVWHSLMDKVRYSLSPCVSMPLYLYADRLAASRRWSACASCIHGNDAYFCVMCWSHICLSHICLSHICLSHICWSHISLSHICLSVICVSLPV